MVVSGRVCRGSGSASAYLSHHWVRRTMKHAFGFVPFAETLGVALGVSLDELEGALGTAGRMLVPAEAGSGGYALLQAYLEKGVCGLPAVLVQSLDEWKSPHRLEFALPVDVRSAWGLEDGDEVTAYIFTSLVPRLRPAAGVSEPPQGRREKPFCDGELPGQNRRAK